MARTGGQDRGLFQRKGAWWVRWAGPYGHEYMEKIDTAKLIVRIFWERCKLAVETVTCSAVVQATA